MTGAVSAALEQEVLGELRRKGLVIWLDKDGAYTSFVDELAARQAAGDFPFPVVGFRGSFLELLFALEPYGSATDRQQLLVHMPGFTEESVRETPILELYEPGTRFRKAIETLVREAATSRVTPDEVDRFVAEQPSLEAADAWLEAAMADTPVGIAAMLKETGPKLLVEALAETDSYLASRAQSKDDVVALRGYLHRLTGMDDRWLAEQQVTGDSNVTAVLDALAAWILSVEYVHDLRRAPRLERLQRLKALSPALVKASCQLTQQLRSSGDGSAYEKRANRVESDLGNELEGVTPDDLGAVDTFREEENQVLSAAVQALLRGEWAKTRSWFEARQGERSFWLQRDQSHKWTWDLVAEAASFGETLAQHPQPFAGLSSLDAAAEAYASGAFEVDRAQRRFEQKRLAKLSSSLPHFGALSEVATSLRRLHRAWADNLARAFATLCRDTGFLPSTSLQQRNLFEEVVHPLTLTGEKVAIFMIDAFRFEMATELVDDLKKPGTVVDLKPRLAELPTITSVGMNALAPVAQNGRLTVAGEFGGFKSSEFTVRTPDDRKRAMGLRSAGKNAVLMKLAEVCEMATPELTRKVKPHPLVVVHSKEIDDAGEANIGLPTFESTLSQIKAAWHHLQLAGVQHFVFTADHGFLIQDETTTKTRGYDKNESQRRHVFASQPRQEAGMLVVPTADLRYDGISGYLLFREDTEIFSGGNAGATFVHGGNSPQERVIPVLTITTKQPERGSLAEYAVEVESLTDVLGLHRLRTRLVFSRGTTSSLEFAAASAVTLALRVPDRAGLRVVVKDVSAPAVLKTGLVQVPVSSQWAEVFFSVEGDSNERVRVELYHPEGLEKVQPARLEEFFTVSVAARARKTSTAPPPPPDAPLGWADTIADEGARKVFLHIEKHGAVTETEVTTLLGSARLFRRFSLEFEEHLAKLPFRVRIETGESGKRYVREGDR
jgi:hypothetical protein